MRADAIVTEPSGVIDYTDDDPHRACQTVGMDLWLTLAVFGTALLSGVFGMAGGLLLFLLLTLRMSLPDALVVHGVAHLMSNGLRAVLSARHIRLRVLGPYALAAGLTLLVCAALRPALSTATALIITGLLPWLEPMFACARLPSVERSLGALSCGGLVTGLHLSAGVAGPLLDQFFLNTRSGGHVCRGLPVWVHWPLPSRYGHTHWPASPPLATSTDRV